MKVSVIGYNLYRLEADKIYKVHAKSIWGLIGKATIIALKSFYSKM